MSASATRLHAIGLMSGTSLDGLDMAWCSFQKVHGKWSFKILKATTLPYSASWKKKLSEAHLLPANDLFALHVEYGQWLGKCCKQFIQKNKITKVDCIASHGHTVFHQPYRRFTFQLGDGNAMHAVTGLPIVFDFRSLDVQLGGQGAPLVPIGDKLLFSNADVCLNLGGIANISLEKGGKRIAFDVCFANMGLNYLADKLQLGFDKNGTIASTGKVNHDLLSSLLNFYEPYLKNRPSLAREQFDSGLFGLLDDETISIPDRLCTFTESIAIKIHEAISANKKQTVLITGGGTRNAFLIKRLQFYFSKSLQVEIPTPQVIDFKEAMVFAFLGVLRLQNKINVLRTVTGASRDSCSGILIG